MVITLDHLFVILSVFRQRYKKVIVPSAIGREVMLLSVRDVSGDEWRLRSVAVRFPVAGTRAEEAPEAVSRPQGMDAGQARRRVRAAAVDRPAQAARVLAARHLPAQPAQVRAHRQRGAQDRKAAAHQGGRQGAHRPHLPRRIHGSVPYLTLPTACTHAPTFALHVLIPYTLPDHD